MKLGKKINDARNKEDLTIRELADITSLSIGFISNLERDQTSPTLSNLEIICKALKINLLDLIKEVSEDDKIVVTRKKDREVVYSDENGIKHKKINGYHKSDAIVTIMKNKTEFSEANWKHHKDEVGVVIEGELEIKVEDRIIRLGKGDSIYISKHASHSHRNPSNKESICHWFMF